MKSNLLSRSSDCCQAVKSLLKSALLSVLVLGAYQASGINYADDDMLLGFRQDAGNFEMVVNLGPATNFYAIPAGTTVTITNFSAATLAHAFSDLSDLKWAAFATTQNDLPDQPTYTCWATRPRLDPNKQTSAWNRRSTAGQARSSSKMDTVGQNALFYSSSFSPDDVVNTSTSLVLAAGDTYGYSLQVGPQGSFGGAWPGNVESLTPSDFVSAQGSVRSDLYECVPTPPSGVGKYWGYFEFRWDGRLTFTAAGGAEVPKLGVTSASPVSGPVEGGTVVTVIGSNFVSGVTVRFGAVVATTVSFVSATSITAVAPASSEGSVNIILKNPDGQEATLTNAFTFIAPTPPSPANILSTSVLGADLVIVSSGATNGTSRVVTSTDITAPLTTWTPVSTNIVGPVGLFTNTIGISPSDVARFYSVVIP